MIHHNQFWCRCAALSMATFFACLGASAQGPADKPGIKSPLPLTGLPSTPYKLDLSFKTDSLKNVIFFDRGTVLAMALTPGTDGVLTLTLDQAQQAAGEASNPLVRLGQLQVEAAKQHRLGVQGQYFPNLSSSYTGLHFNKHPGQVLTLQGPLGGTHQVSVNILNKDENVVNLLGVQPITPLFSIYQLARIARADENIARAKAGMPVTETASKVEKNFFELLVAQRELISARADAKKIQARWLTSSSSGVTSVSTEQEADTISAEKVVVGPASKVKELTAALDETLGLPEGTKLELVPPEPLVENISLNEATEKATANPEVIEAEQTAIKAHAGLALTKLAYVPTVAALGGYTNQTSINLVFPRAAAYIGVTASWTIFDGFKREHGVKEVKAQAEMADLGVQLTKAKVTAAVKSSYFELERSRQFTQLARRMASSARLVEASYKADDPEVESAHAKLEADMFRAELEYRQAYAKLKALMGSQ
jgi:outer membrane protein TolC